MRPVRSNSCCAPPDCAAFLRRGLANRRCLAALPVDWLRAALRDACFFPRGEALRTVDFFGARAAGALEPEASMDGAWSFAGSLSSFWISRLVTFFSLGAG